MKALMNNRIVLLWALAFSLLLCSCGNEEFAFVNSSSSSDETSDFSSEEQKSSEEASESISELEENVSKEISQIYDTPEEYVRYGLADAVEKAEKSVVSVAVTSKRSGGFLGEYTVEENGSGVIISKEGHIATNCHVVELAEKIKVYLFDGEEYDASIVGKDSKTDLAVIKIESESELVPATFSDSATIRLGDFVFAVGNALGKYKGSVTMGIISALSRDVVVSGENMKMLQTDAALNSGNSGGGLFDSHGYLVGIVTAKDSDSSSEGVGFAIPSQAAKAVLEDIMTHGYVTGRPTLGFSTVDITSMREAAYYGVDWIGVYISSVEEGSFGETAGLKSRDYIYSVNEEVITTTDRLEEILEESKIGDTLLLEIWRGNDSIDVILMIGEDVG